MVDIIAQTFGIFGMLLAILSFQCKKNTRFFLLQALSGLLFSVNFFMIGAIGGALCNAANVARGALFSKSDRVKWKLVVNLVMYFACMVVSLIFVWGDAKQMILTMLTISASVASTAAMWTGSGAFIRKIQLYCSSPLWLIHNCFNFSLGGILCESFNMLSVIVSFIRYGKDGFEK
ncbi:MAG: YgjV family protein [Clostridia bacterium]|nr:YgjV family protein [Clostridia bacterium]